MLYIFTDKFVYSYLLLRLVFHDTFFTAFHCMFLHCLLVLTFVYIVCAFDAVVFDMLMHVLLLVLTCFTSKVDCMYFLTKFITAYMCIYIDSVISDL